MTQIAEMKKNPGRQSNMELLLQSAGVGTWEWNVQTGASIYNERWAELIGYTLQELQPLDVKTWEKYTHPEDMKRITAALQEHFDKKTPYYSVESRMRHKNGRWVWILNRGRVMEWDAVGKPLRMLGTHMDITRLKETEEALRESKQQLELALDCAGVGLWAWDLQTAQFYISPQYKRILGYSETEGESGYAFWRNRWHPDDIPKIKQVIRAFRQGVKQKYELVHRLRNKSGNWQWCILRGRRVMDAGGKTSRWMGTIADVTALMEECEKNKELEQIFAVNPDLLCIIDRDNKFIKLNQAWTRLLGYSIPELAGKSYFSFVHPEDAEVTKNRVEILTEQSGDVNFINRYRHRDGSYRYIEWQAKPYKTMLFAAARDVTDRINEEAELKSNLKIKEAYLELMQLKNLSIQELMDRSLEEILALTGSSLGYIFVCDEGKQQLLLQSWRKAGSEIENIKAPERVYSLKQLGALAKAVHSRQAVVINEFAMSGREAYGYPENELFIKSFLAMPVIDREEIVAVVGLANKKQGYHAKDVFTLKMMMNIVWTHEKRIKNEMQLRKERIFYGAMVLSKEGIISTDELGRILVMNQVAESLFGRGLSEVSGEDLRQVFQVRDAEIKEKTVDPVCQVLTSGEPMILPPNTVIVDKNGVEHYAAGSCAPAVDSDGKVIGAVLNFRDITTAWLKQKQDEYVTTHDALTGAYNRLFFERKIAEVMARSHRYEEPLSMAILDLDRFKQVNDTWGHPVVDAVLKETAALAQAAIRVTDYLVRLGGEEFIILMPQTTIGNAQLAAEKIRRTLEAHVHPVAGQVTASFGVAEYLKTESFEHWYKRVDGALYRAKDNGRNCVVAAKAEEKLPIAFVQLEWQSEWESGDAGIDEEHRQVLKLGNRLIYLLLAGEARETIDRQVDLLLTHIEKHFFNEVCALKAVAFPEVKMHEKSHQTLLKKALKLKAEYHRDAFHPAAFFSFMVDDIIVGHMLKEDVQFFSYIKAKNAG